jgi:hypothetical protein
MSDPEIGHPRRLKFSRAYMVFEKKRNQIDVARIVYSRVFSEKTRE